MIMIFSIDVILKCFIQFACTNLDGLQKEGVIFYICFRKRGYPESGGFVRKGGCSNPGGNCADVFNTKNQNKQQKENLLLFKQH